MTALARTARVCIWPDYYGITFRDPRNQQLSGIDKPGVLVGVQADTFMEPVMGAALKQARLTEQFAFSALLQEMRPLPTSMLDLECRYVSVNRAW